jgi:hypothetical protein
MRAPSIRILKHTASTREKRVSSINKPYDPLAWRYDEMGVPKPPVGEDEMKRAHVVPIGDNLSMRRLPKVASSSGSSWQGNGLAESSTSSKRSVHSPSDSSLRTQGIGEVKGLPSPRSTLLPAAPTPAPQSAPQVESRDVSAPEDLQIVRELRAEVVRLQHGLPSHQQSLLEGENARLERECEGLRRRVEGYQLTLEQFGRRMAEMEAENVTLKVQVEIMHKQQATNAAAKAGYNEDSDPSAELLNELSELLRSEKRKSRISRGDLPPRSLPDESDAAGRSVRARPVSQSPADLLMSMRRANAVLEAELRGEAPDAGTLQRRALFTTDTGISSQEHSKQEKRRSRHSRGRQPKDSATKYSAGGPTGDPEPRLEETPAEARLAAAERAERRLRELEAQLKQTKVEEMADKMRQIESKLNESLGKAAKPAHSFDALSLDAQLAELGLCGGESSPERGGPRSPDFERVD